MATLFLLRHSKSQWNVENRFAGWVDNSLSPQGYQMAKDAADKLANLYDSKVDAVYTSSLIRNKETVLRVFENIPDKFPVFIHLDGGPMQKKGNFADISPKDIKVFVSDKLNERYYGKLQGLNKEETIKKYGQEKVHLWRRSYTVAPPGGESLKDVYKRAVPFYKKYVEKDLLNGKNIMLVASHNSLRAIIKYIENISDQKIADVELEFGSLITYEFDKKLALTSQKYFNN